MLSLTSWGKMSKFQNMEFWTELTQNTPNTHTHLGLELLMENLGTSSKSLPRILPLPPTPALQSRTSHEGLCVGDWCVETTASFVDIEWTETG